LQILYLHIKNSKGFYRSFIMSDQDRSLTAAKYFLKYAGVPGADPELAKLKEVDAVETTNLMGAFGADSSGVVAAIERGEILGMGKTEAYDGRYDGSYLVQGPLAGTTNE
jgi:hypothetical protein